MKISHEWLQTFFTEGTLPSVEDIERKLMFHAYEVEGVEAVNGTNVIDVDVLPNRAADSLSHRGIARELSALFELPMLRDPSRVTVDLTPTDEGIQLTLDPEASCSYYIAARIVGVTVGESPAWLKNRLAAIGQKSINNVVDATNYCLFELGQPTHVFDSKKFAGANPAIATRRARNDERITLLGNTEATLRDTMTVIVDAVADVPIAVAGVKGGVHAEVTEHTTDIILESAKFDPIQTRKTAQALKLRTDASARFENDVADQLPHFAMHALVQLIMEVAGGTLEGYTVAGSPRKENVPVQVDTAHVAKLLGTSISGDEIEKILTRLDFAYTRDDETFTTTAPFERRDITLPENVIEEIGRLHGYNTIESKQLPAPEKLPGVHKKFAYAEVIRNTLTSLGSTEAHLYSLRDSGEIALRNALASDKGYLRSNLTDGIRDALEVNERYMPLLGLYERVSLFEVGNVFTPEGESTHVAVGVRVSGGKKREERATEFLTGVRGQLQTALGGVSLPEPQGDVLEFSLDAILDALPELAAYPEVSVVNDGVTYSPVSAYPFILRDIAVWVPLGVDPATVQNIISKHSGILLKRSDLFDTFEKDGRISYAFHLVFQSMVETLTDEKIGEIMGRIEEEIALTEGWEIR